MIFFFKKHRLNSRSVAVYHAVEMLVGAESLGHVLHRWMLWSSMVVYSVVSRFPCDPMSHQYSSVFTLYKISMSMSSFFMSYRTPMSSIFYFMGLQGPLFGVTGLQCPFVFFSLFFSWGILLPKHVYIFVRYFCYIHAYPRYLAT